MRSVRSIWARASAPVEVQTIAGWWVYIPPLKSKAEVDRRIAELSEQGVNEYFAVENGGEMHNAISLGIFKSEEAANNYLQTLRNKGVRSAQVGRRDHRVTQTAFLVRNPDPGDLRAHGRADHALPRQRAEGERLPRVDLVRRGLRCMRSSWGRDTAKSRGCDVGARLVPR